VISAWQLRRMPLHAAFVFGAGCLGALAHAAFESGVVKPTQASARVEAAPPATAILASNPEAGASNDRPDTNERFISPRSAEPPAPAPARSVVNACERLAVKLPSFPRQRCRNVPLVDSGARSVKREPILVHEQLPIPEPTDGAVRVLFVGGIHGDELSASELALRWLDRLGTAEAQQFHWRYIPVLNPDGVLAPRPTRVNANGVDLNRNFPSGDWAGGALRYWERMTMKDPRRFPGRAPVTEPESRLLNEEIARFAPDVIISVHAPLGLLDFDGPTAAPSRFGKLYLEPVGVYPGSLGSYSGITLGIPVVTLELPHALKMPSAEEQNKIWTDMLAWLAKQPSRVAQGPKQP
jgi:murein peptide amidase A